MTDEPVEPPVAVKKWYLSKILWTNLIAIGALVMQTYVTGFVLAPEEQIGILAVINLILRLVTSEGLEK